MLFRVSEVTSFGKYFATSCRRRAECVSCVWVSAALVAAFHFQTAFCILSVIVGVSETVRWIPSPHLGWIPPPQRQLAGA
ncbi:unnamed protein product [Heligmosomoides polygyrus]|uniref:Uncharacterized protein n=1 Tax=Heligmosomoides polygyrus TaxID=6339 RepID=A0A183FFD9_HELPZ|nr:unnamed protein product [Heligmosomoides polygyrus]